MRSFARLVFSLLPVIGALAVPATSGNHARHLDMASRSADFRQRIRDMIANATQENDISKRDSVFSTSKDGVDSAGFYYSLYNDNHASAGYTEFSDSGRFEVGWNLASSSEFLGGKGYRDTKTRSLTWDGYFTATGDYTLAIYGWTLNPVTEWYIVEQHGTGTPGNGNVRGTVTSDGGTYDVYDLYYSNVPEIYGVTSFHQYWSIRKVGRSTGTVDVTKHFDTWKSLGLNPGTPIFQMVTLEAFKGQGYLDFTVS
ncbi:putative endo-1,4-beta-xylanase A [Talaromyces pinophilus]|nr:putative endo-1,4-beta-xylanase A [Talaromyces pinophilus]